MQPSPADRPHVAFFLPDLAGGGAQKMVSALANGLAARGYYIDMVLVRASGIYLNALARSVHLVDLRAHNSYSAIPKLAGYLRSRHPRVLVASLPVTSALAVIARRLARFPTHVAIRIENTVSAQRRVRWKKILEQYLLSWLYPRADHIIAVSRAVASDAAEYLHIPLSRIDVLYNPVLADQRKFPLTQIPPHPWFADGCPPVILAAGRLVPAKDFATLMQAFARVRRLRPARLMILGEGDQRSSLLSLARGLSVSDDLALPGFVEDPYPFMQRSSVFVLSSIYEGLPTVLIEALANGCPVISTDCPGGSREILADGAYGELVPMRDIDAMANAIRRVLDGERKTVDRAWLDQFKLERILDQNIQLLGLPGDPR